MSQGKGREAISELHQEAEYLTGEGNTFVLSLKGQGKVVKEKPGKPVPAGKDITADAFLVARLDKGKIIEVWIKGGVTIS